MWSDQFLRTFARLCMESNNWNGRVGPSCNGNLAFCIKILLIEIPTLVSVAPERGNIVHSVHLVSVAS